MKKWIGIVAAGLAVTSLCGCTMFRGLNAEIDTLTLSPAMGGAAVTDVAAPASAAPTTDAPTTVPTTEATTAPTTEPTTAAPTDGRVYQGTTAKGYPIFVRDGVTYVETQYGDVIIANKTYTLPEDYGPGGLTPECDAAYDELKAAAAAEGLSLWIVSGYRSYSTQQGLYARYCAQDGVAAADTYSARPGHSEHQTGLAIDVNSLEYDFAFTPEGQWLAAHAHEYGFVIRYAQDKQDITGYMYEPWHIRYLGKGLAAEVHASGLCLEEFFGVTSVYAD